MVKFTVAFKLNAGRVIIDSAPPQPSKPQVSAPQPVSLNASGVPTEDVADKPVKETEISSLITPSVYVPC